MRTNNDSDLSTPNKEEVLKKLIINHMNTIVSSFKEENPNLDVSEVFSQKTGCNKKSLNNWLAGRNFPHQNSIVSFYLHFAEYDINNIPTFVNEYLSLRGCSVREQIESKELSSFFDGKRIEELLYRLTRIKFISSASTIIKNLGSTGHKSLNNLIQENLITMTGDNISLGKVSPSGTSKLASAYIKNHINNFDFSRKPDGSDTGEKVYRNGMYEIADSLIEDMLNEIAENYSVITRKYEEKSKELLEIEKDLPTSPVELSLAGNKIEFSNNDGRIQ